MIAVGLHPAIRRAFVNGAVLSTGFAEPRISLGAIDAEFHSELLDHQHIVGPLVEPVNH